MTGLANDLDRTTRGARGKVRSAAIMACFGIFCVSCGDQTPNYKMAVLVPSADVTGTNGMAFDTDGALIVGSMTGRSIYKIDRKTGSVETLIGPPLGTADDVAIGPDGTMAWTAMDVGEIRAKRPGGEVEVLASGLPLINSIGFTKDGRLFAGQVLPTGSLYEIDLSGKKPAHAVIDKLGALNGFDITDDNILFGPVPNKGKIIRIDLNDKTVTEIADGFIQPTGVKLDSKGQIYVVDYIAGTLTRIDSISYEKQLITTVDPPIDNLVISSDDLIYLSHPCDNGIEEVNPETGAVRRVVRGSIGSPAGLTLIEHNNKEALLVAAMHCQNIIDLETGAVTRVPRQGHVIWSAAIARSEEAIIISGFVFGGAVQWLDPVSGEPTKTLRGFQAPYDIKLTEDTLLVADYLAGKIYKIKAPYDGDKEVLADELDGPVAMVLGDDQTLLVSAATAGVIVRIDLSDGAQTVVYDGLAGPEGLALMADGRLVVAEVGAKRLVIIDLDSKSLELVAENLPVGLAPMIGAPGPYLPTGVVVDASGVIYMTSDVNKTVLKFTPR